MKTELSLSCRTHIFIKVHEVGDDLDVGVVDSGLMENFLQDVSQAGREDEDRYVVLVQPVEELLKAFPGSKHGKEQVSGHSFTAAHL